MKVIFDSSFLMAVSEKPTAWSEDLSLESGKLEPIMLDCVRKEMELISSRVGKRAKVAKVALELSKGFAVFPCGRASPDEEIVSNALSRRAAVATMDQALAVELRSRGVVVFGLRSGRAVRT